MKEENQWNGVSNKGNKSTFIEVGSGKATVFWTHGASHKLTDCTLPKNQEIFSEGKNKMKEAIKNTRKSGNGGGNRNKNGGGGKFCKPSDEEKNRRTIDESTMFYHNILSSVLMTGSHWELRLRKRS
jgi:hypothetical protein